jgi:hypothetical protein
MLSGIAVACYAARPSVVIFGAGPRVHLDAAADYLAGQTRRIPTAHDLPSLSADLGPFED